MSNLLAIQQVSIRAETSLADPDTCKFIVSCTLHPGRPFSFDNQERVAGSPLSEQLFSIFGTAIRTQLLNGVPAILEMHHHTGAQVRSDAELAEVIRVLLDNQVNKSIANHGGKISIVDVRQGKLFIAISDRRNR
jgi:hypothetical protein